MAGTWLDVIIGTVYVFLLFALFLSAATEAIASVLKLRGRALEVALKRLIADPAEPVEHGGFGFIEKLFGGTKSNLPLSDCPHSEEASAEHSLESDGATSHIDFSSIWTNPLIGGGKERFLGIMRPIRPSYIGGPQFTSALFAALGSAADGTFASNVERGVASLPPGRLRETLVMLATEAQGDVDKFKQGIERWFDGAMNRLSGEYKRYSQLLTFLIGFALAMCNDINAINIIKYMSQNPAVAAAFADSAAEAVKNNGDLQKRVDALRPQVAPQAANPDDLKQVLVDATAKYDDARVAFEKEVARASGQSAFSFPKSDRNDGMRWLGYFITALAGMLGAPFWFDLLQKLVNLRGSGPKPVAKGEQK